MLSERCQTEKAIYYIIPFIQDAQNMQIHGKRSRSVASRGQEKRGNRKGLPESLVENIGDGSDVIMSTLT